MIDLSDEVLDRLKNKLADLDPEGAKRLIQEALDAGISPGRIINEGMARGMDVVGEKYEEKEYFLGELIMAGEVMKEGIELLEPYMKEGDLPTIGKAVVATVKGDLHDIGKNIFATLLKAAGFEVIDLGVDVSPETLVEAVNTHRPDVLGMSTLLTLSMSGMEMTIERLKEAGLREHVKVIIGGAPITKEFAEKIGADLSAKDAVEGVAICKRWVGSQ